MIRSGVKRGVLNKAYLLKCKNLPINIKENLFLYPLNTITFYPGENAFIVTLIKNLEIEERRADRSGDTELFKIIDYSLGDIKTFLNEKGADF